MRTVRLSLVGLALGGGASPAWAGMPSAELIVTELGQRRLEELSFFLVGFLVMAGAVRWLWNWLRRDFTSLPELSYGRSVSLLLLWGLLMTVVLAMISGARELMTPAAWVPNGVTYKLADASLPVAVAPGVNETPDRQRRERLENLRFGLWQFASSHEGRFPSADEASEIPAELWRVESDSPLRYVYVPSLSLKSSEGVLVYEPEIYGDAPYVIRVSGAIEKRIEAARASATVPLATPPTDPVTPAAVPASGGEAPPSDARGGR